MHPDLASILGPNPIAFRMPDRIDKMGRFAFKFPSNVDLMCRNYASCRKGSKLEHLFQAQLLIKRILGALLFTANVNRSGFTAAAIEFDSIFDIKSLPRDDPRLAHVALKYAISLCADFISDVELRKSRAETKRLAGEEPRDIDDPSQKKKTRTIPEPSKQAEVLVKERKFIASANKSRKFQSSSSPGSFRYTVPSSSIGRPQHRRSFAQRDSQPRDQDGRFTTPNTGSEANRGHTSRGRGAGRAGFSRK